MGFSEHRPEAAAAPLALSEQGEEWYHWYISSLESSRASY